MSVPMICVADLDDLRHMLGVTPKTPRGYRNYFIAAGDDVMSMERLREAGLVERNDQHQGSCGVCYHATLSGAKAIGLRRLPE